MCIKMKLDTILVENFECHFRLCYFSLWDFLWPDRVDVGYWGTREMSHQQIFRNLNNARAVLLCTLFADSLIENMFKIKSDAINTRHCYLVFRMMLYMKNVLLNLNWKRILNPCKDTHDNKWSNLFVYMIENLSSASFVTGNITLKLSHCFRIRNTLDNVEKLKVTFIFNWNRVFSWLQVTGC
jgi:hypothetical protein